MRPDSSGLRFSKMSGGGNDFIALDDAAALTGADAAAICARGHSLGADGIFSIERIESREPSEAAIVRMVYRNGDGSRAGLCVNGTRCAALLAFDRGWARERVRILTDAGAIEAHRAGDAEVALRLPPPSEPAREATVVVEGQELPGWFIDTGVPHFVLEWPESLVTAPVLELGSEIRHAEEFADGANVDFVRMLAGHRLEVRTFERGVEGETLACGTGVLAAAAVAVTLGRAGFPLTALTSGGFELGVDGRIEGGRITEWTLSGDARLVARGTLEPGSLAVPDPPLWSL